MLLPDAEIRATTRVGLNEGGAVGETLVESLPDATLLAVARSVPGDELLPRVAERVAALDEGSGLGERTEVLPSAVGLARRDGLRRGRRSCEPSLAVGMLRWPRLDLVHLGDSPVLLARGGRVREFRAPAAGHRTGWRRRTQKRLRLRRGDRLLLSTPALRARVGAAPLRELLVHGESARTVCAAAAHARGVATQDDAVLVAFFGHGESERGAELSLPASRAARPPEPARRLVAT